MQTKAEKPKQHFPPAQASRAVEEIARPTAILLLFVFFPLFFVAKRPGHALLPPAAKGCTVQRHLVGDARSQLQLYAQKSPILAHYCPSPSLHVS